MIARIWHGIMEPEKADEYVAFLRRVACEVSAAALFAHETMPTMPADTNALTSRPRCDVCLRSHRCVPPLHGPVHGETEAQAIDLL